MQKPVADLLDVIIAHIVSDILKYSSNNAYDVNLSSSNICDLYKSLSFLWKKCIYSFPDSGILLVQLGNCFVSLVEFDRDPIYLEGAVNLYDSALPVFKANAPDWAVCVLGKASALHKLAMLGVNERNNFKDAAILYDYALSCLEEQTSDWGDCVRGKALVLLQLAELCINSRKNLKDASSLYDSALKYYEEQTPDWLASLMGKVETLASLAASGNNSRNNLKDTFALLDNASEVYQKQTLEWAICLLTKASLLSRFADLSNNSRKNCEDAIKYFNMALPCFTEHPSYWASCLMGKSGALFRLASLGVNKHKHLEESVTLCDSVLQHFDEQTPEGAICLLRKTICLFKLAELGDNERKNLSHAILSLYLVPSSSFQPGSYLWLCYQRYVIHASSSLSEQLRKSKVAIDMIERERNNYRTAEDKSEFLEKVSELYLFRFSLLIDSNQYEEAWHTLHLCKNRTVIEAAQNLLPPPQKDPGLAKLYSEIKKLDEQLLDLETKEQVAEGLINNLREQKSSKVGQYLDLHPAKVPSLQETFTSFASLGSNSVLIELVSTKGGTYVFCYRPNTPHNFEPLLIPTATESWVRQVLQNIENINNNISEIKDSCKHDEECRLKLHKQYGNELQECLTDLGNVWRSIFDHLSLANECIHTIVVTGHGEYSLLPHACAFWNDCYLIERKQIVILPTPCISKNISTKISTISKIAGWAVNAVNLSTANDEAKESAKFWEQSGIAKIIPNCKKEEVLNLSNGKYVLHLIGHANFALYDPQQSAFHCSDYDLYPSDISSSMNLDSCNLVVLSACSAGAHAPRRGDSFAGLAHAFYDAGAPSIIAPLWFVYDETAKDFSTAFYKNWVDKSVSLASAYQSAMINLIEKYSDFPQFWMAWQLIGAWETKAGPPTPSN
jgi:tetratricopeptide (TPR) repeat protein